MYQYKIEIDNAGNLAVLTTTKLFYKDEVFPMIGQTVEMNYYQDQDIFVIPVPGPDKIVTLGDLSVDIPEIPPFERREAFKIIPNPAIDRVQIVADFFINRIEIMDITGVVHVKEEPNNYNPTLNVSTLSGGIYLVRLVSGANVVHQKMYVY